MIRAHSRLRIYLMDERHEYSGSHQMRRRKAAADLREIEAEVATLREKVRDAEAFYKPRRQPSVDWWAERRYFVQQGIDQETNPDGPAARQAAGSEGEKP